MPTPVKTVSNMTKHLTKAEMEARTVAESTPARKPRKPKHIAQDKAASRHWADTLKDLEDLDIIDRADSDTLAAYCEILSHSDALREDEKRLAEIWEKDSNLTAYKTLCAVRRDILALRNQQLNFATKLGLTPEARARLAKRAAESDDIDPDADLFA